MSAALDALPDGRYFDGTYEWDKEGEDWTALRAPSGMPQRPDLAGLERVRTVREPITATRVADPRGTQDDVNRPAVHDDRCEARGFSGPVAPGCSCSYRREHGYSPISVYAPDAGAILGLKRLAFDGEEFVRLADVLAALGH